MNKLKDKKAYHDFLTKLSDGLLKELGKDYETKEISNSWNNGIPKNGILIQKKGTAVSPAIYLDEYYDEYRTGKVLSDIVRQVLYTYRHNAKEGELHGYQDIDLSSENIREKIVYRIVNYSKNAAMLQDVPHIRFLDLAIFFQIVVYHQEDGIGTIRFTAEHYQEHEKKLFSSFEELYQLAMQNTMRLFPACLNSMETIIKNLQKGQGMQEGLPLLPAPCPEHSSPTLYVLSNAYSINGASCLLYPDILAQIQNFFHSEFYVLPSSIHEVILISANASIKREELNDMIREINLTQVPADEVLSDHAYHSEELSNMLLALSKGAIPPHGIA